MNLTIAYITYRQEPHEQWFLQSLLTQMNRYWEGKIKVLIITPREHFPNNEKVCGEMVGWIVNNAKSLHEVFPLSFHTPKPSVWAGPHRLTKQDFFDASNARNTALCLAPDGYICFVDDLSVLMPGWLAAVREAMAGGYIACGKFQKVKNLVVENGVVKSFTEFPEGLDHSRSGRPGQAVQCPPQWAYGCSLVGPVEAFLAVNGYPEDLTAGMGYEDSVTGMTIAKHGYQFRYDTRMFTMESEEDHHNQLGMKRIDPGQSPDDKSHAMLDIAAGLTRFPNYFGEGFEDIRALRQHVMAGGEFPIRKKPEVEWFTGVPLSAL